MEPFIQYFSKDELGKALFKHFSHVHFMKYFDIFPEDEAFCFACQSPCLGSPAYSCVESYYCKYYLHKRCFECPLEVTHTSHPQHPIALRVLDHEKIVDCESCKRKSCSFVFNCSKCDWNLCIDCYLLPKQLSKHYFHSHDDHPNLSLLISPCCAEFACSLCHMNFKSSTPRFGCTKCGFVVDVECALTPPIKHEGQGHFQHVTHPHPMTLVDRKDGDKDDGVNKHRCFGCDLPCESGLAYFSCINCKYFLHKSCAELPLKLQFHPLVNGYLRFSLWPQEQYNEYFPCHLCCKMCYGFRFKSSSKQINPICGRCIFSRPSNIKYEGHDHFLCFAEKVHMDVRCNAGYDNYCKLPVTSLELRSTESFMYRCFDCNFNIHLLCGPLPCTIEYEYHRHSLVLVDLVVEDVSDEYYCDICEDKRDPRIQVYHCHECKYVAHVHCLISEVVATLRGDLRSLRLKSANNYGRKKNEIPTDQKEVASFQNTRSKFISILEKLPRDDKLTLWCDFDTKHIGFHPPMDMIDAVRIRKLTRFSTEYFGKFVDWLSNYMEFNDSEIWQKRRIHELLFLGPIVAVDGYMVPSALVETLVRFLRKYGDISSNSKSSIEMKSIAFCFLCQALDSMRDTGVGDMTSDHLRKWYFYVNFAKRIGFDVEFMFQHLKYLAHVFIGLQATAERNEFRTKEVRAKHIIELQNELNLMKSKSYSSFANWGEFLMECLSMGLLLMGKNVHLSDPLLILN